MNSLVDKVLGKVGKYGLVEKFVIWEIFIIK